MWNSIEGHPPPITQKHFCTLHVALDQELVGFRMVDALFNFTTMLFNTNPPKLWPINTIGWRHSYLHKTYSFAMLIFQGIFNWLLHFMLLTSIFVWFLLLLCQVFLVRHATVTVVLDGSSLGFIYNVGWEVCQSQCKVQVGTLVAVGILSHSPHADSSSINKVTKFLVKGFY
jgi:hypothetical protein